MNADPFIKWKRRGRILFWLGLVDYLLAVANAVDYTKRGGWMNFTAMCFPLIGMALAWITWERLGLERRSCLRDFRQLRRRRIGQQKFLRQMGAAPLARIKLNRKLFRLP